MGSCSPGQTASRSGRRRCGRDVVRAGAPSASPGHAPGERPDREAGPVRRTAGCPDPTSSRAGELLQHRWRAGLRGAERGTNGTAAAGRQALGQLGERPCWRPGRMSPLRTGRREDHRRSRRRLLRSAAHRATSSPVPRMSALTSSNPAVVAASAIVAGTSIRAWKALVNSSGTTTARSLPVPAQVAGDGPEVRARSDPGRPLRAGIPSRSAAAVISASMGPRTTRVPAAVAQPDQGGR